jgi:hypothetical protein
MLRKSPLFSGIAILTIAVFIFPAIAAAAPAKSTAADKVAAAKADVNEQRIPSLKTRGNQEISRRINALESLLAKLDKIKKLSDQQKNDFLAQINLNINDLNTLKDKIDSDSDLTTLQSDVKSIVDSYRIYALFMPKIRLLSGANVASEIADTLTTLSNKLEQRISEANADGRDTTSLEQLINDMKIKIADANLQLENMEKSVIPLAPSDYPGNKNNLIDARKLLQSAHQDLVDARHDAESIVAGLKEISGSSQSSLSSDNNSSSIPASD